MEDVDAKSILCCLILPESSIDILNVGDIVYEAFWSLFLSYECFSLLIRDLDLSFLLYAVTVCELSLYLSIPCKHSG